MVELLLGFTNGFFAPFPVQNAGEDLGQHSEQIPFPFIVDISKREQQMQDPQHAGPGNKGDTVVPMGCQDLARLSEISLAVIDKKDFVFFGGLAAETMTPRNLGAGFLDLGGETHFRLQDKCL